jgi:ABC transport system ATP-binding/permease protein
MLTIGRDPSNEIVVDDPIASRHHAIVRSLPDGTWSLSDRSENGTVVAGRRIHRGATTMRDGSSMAIGSCTYVLHRGMLVKQTKIAVEPQLGAAIVSQVASRGLEARSVTCFSESGRPLVRDVSLSLDIGESLAIVGPSGSGKSTLLRALAGVVPARRGSVFLNQANLYERYEELRTLIGFVPQDDVLHSTLNVRQALMFGARLRFSSDVCDADVAKRVDDVVSQLGLCERAGHRIDRLSGGERKRVNVGLELVTQPSLLLLDEPTAGLDPGSEASVMMHLGGLKGDGRTVVVVTHATQFVDMFDRVLVLNQDGRVAFFGRPDERVNRFGTEIWSEIFASLEHDDVFVLSNSAETGIAQWPDRGEPLEVVGAKVVGAKVLSPLRQFTTLVRRFASVLRSDRKHLALLIAQAPVIGVLLMVLTNGALDVTDSRGGTKGGMALLSVILGVAYIGASNATRELVKERPIFERERSFGLSRGAYILSKFAMLTCLTLMQSMCLVLIGLALAGGPQTSVFGWWPPVVELLVTTFLTGCAALSVGLLISAVSSTADRATTALPIVLLTMYLLSGGPTNPQRYPVLRELSHVNVAKWGLAGVGATADLNYLNGCTATDSHLDVPVATSADRCQMQWAHTNSALTESWAALVGISLACLGLAVLGINRHAARPSRARVAQYPSRSLMRRRRHTPLTT